MDDKKPRGLTSSVLTFDDSPFSQHKIEDGIGLIGRNTDIESFTLTTFADYQKRVLLWMKECFGENSSEDKEERCQRFLEEALELIQACGTEREVAHRLVDYVYDRPKGDIPQEIGGVALTLAVLCESQNEDFITCAEKGLKEVWNRIPEIRDKQRKIPIFTPR